ncbi:MAG: DUF2797 domain-containing protein, partial [Crocinitomicaceae bacterium]|nr:DUF2797 domain-containing protein [Crocinitomicaceae bacterium]
QNGAMSFAAARELADQVSESLGWQKINAVTPISARVCAWLCWSAGNSSLLEIPKHAELAWRLNTTRESITRTFQKLQADGLIQREDEKWRIHEELPSDLTQYWLEDDQIFEFNYPVLNYPSKVSSLSFDKTAVVKGTLTGIRGQYLIFDEKNVINIRRHTGYEIDFDALS